MVCVPKLAGLWYATYHTTYTELIGCMFQQLLSTRSKITTVFVRNLSGLRCVNYKSAATQPTRSGRFSDDAARQAVDA